MGRTGPPYRAGDAVGGTGQGVRAPRPWPWRGRARVAAGPGGERARRV